MLSPKVSDSTLIDIAGPLVNDPNFSVKYLIELDKAVIAKKLEKLGMQSVRAKQIKLAAEQINARHHGAIPEEKSDLCNLSGVGQKLPSL